MSHVREKTPLARRVHIPESDVRWQSTNIGGQLAPIRIVIALATVMLSLLSASFVPAAEKSTVIGCINDPASSAMGPLRVHPSNSLYFADACGKAVYLTGSHTHLSLKDGGGRAPGVSPLDFDAYLDLLADNNHNFIRLWSGWELTMFDPLPWRRTGPGSAADGKPEFDLTKLDDVYFERLRARVLAARDRNIYVSVMLFEGWLLRFVPNSAAQHPFNSANNINGINADTDQNGTIIEAHSLNNPAVTAVQEAYVTKVIDTLNDLDNVLYEVANESAFPESVEWQYHIIDYIKKYQATKPKQHPVGITSAGFSSTYDDLEDLLDSPADWISPGRPKSLAYDFLDNPPAADGSKVIISDSDHLGKLLNNPSWVWKTMTRGHNPIFMDVFPPLDALESGDANFIRKTLGYARTYADKTDLSAMTPRGDLASTGYALAGPAAEYLAYQPGSGTFTVNLQAGSYDYEWFNPETGSIAGTGSFSASAGSRTFSPPFSGSAVLYLKSAMGTKPAQGASLPKR